MRLSYRLTMLLLSLFIILIVGRVTLGNFEFATGQFWFISGALLLNNDVIVERAERLVREYDVRPPNITLAARALSGGNQQKLIVAREFDSKPRLVLVAQPTRGVDIGATEFIHRKLIEIRDAGGAVLLVSAELDEILSLSDRVVVIYEGRIVGEVDPKTVSEEEIGLMMTGGRT